MKDQIKPFWLNLPTVFLYPARPQVLGYISLLSLAGLLTFIPLLGLVVPLVIAIIAIRYCCQTLYHVAMGEEGIPATGAQDSGSSFFFRLVVIYIVLYGMVGLVFAATGNYALTVIASMLVQLLIPAATMSLAIDDDLGRAINPVLLLNIVLRIGAPYLALWAFISLLSAAMMKLPMVLLPVLPEWLIIPALIFVFLYFTVATYYLMGYVAYQYHEALGFVPASMEGALAGQTEEDSEYREIDDQILAGHAAEALELLVEKVKAEPENLELQDKLNRLFLLTRRDDELALKQASAYIRRLMNEGKNPQALKAFQRTSRVLGNVPVDEAEHALALAKLAYTMRDGKSALKLLARYGQRFDKHELVPEAELLSAQLLMDVMDRDDAARQLLLKLQKEYPSHPIQARVKSHLSVLDRMSQQPA